MDDEPVHSKGGEDSGAFMLAAVFIYSLTGGPAPQLCLRGPFSPVSPPEVWDSEAFGIRSVLSVQDHTNTHTNAHLTLVLTMNEYRNNESRRKNEGWSRGLCGPRQGRSYIDWFSKRILRLLVVLLNKGGLWKQRSHRPSSTPEAAFSFKE